MHSFYLQNKNGEIAPEHRPLTQYFGNIANNFNSDDDRKRFEENWRALRSCGLPGPKLTTIFYYTSSNLVHLIHNQRLPRYIRNDANKAIKTIRNKYHKLQNQSLNSLDLFKLKHLNKFLYTSAQLRLTPSERFMNSWKEKFKTAQAQEANAFDFLSNKINTLYALAILDACSPQDRTEFGEIARSEINNICVNDIEKLSTKDECMSLKSIFTYLCVFYGKDVSIELSTSNTSSKIEKRFRSVLKKHGFDVVNKTLSKINRETDQAYLINDRFAFIENDGPYHFLIYDEHQPNNNMYLGTDIYKAKILEKLRPNAINVKMDNTIAHKIITSSYDQQRLYLSSLKKGIHPQDVGTRRAYMTEGRKLFLGSFYDLHHP